MRHRSTQVGQSTFAEIIKTPINYFNKNLNPKQIALYYDRLCYHSPETLAAAFDDIIATRKPTPGQFPSIVEIFSEIKKGGTTRPLDHVEYDRCDDCHSTGQLFVYEIKNGTYIEVAYLCARCNNWLRNFDSLDYVDGDGKRHSLVRIDKKELLQRTSVLGMANEKTTQEARRINLKARNAGANIINLSDARIRNVHSLAESLPDWVTE